MSKFKVGDRIRQIASGWGTSPEDNGKEAIVLGYKDRTLILDRIGNWKNNSGGWEEGFGLISTSETNKTTMKTISNFYKKLTDEKVQALSKAGYLNGDLEPTEKARKAIEEIQFFANYDALVTRANEEIAAEEKKD